MEAQPSDYILVVEDHAFLRDLLIQLLEGEGFAAVGAASGREALEVMTKNLPRVVLLDLNLPDMNGVQFRQQQREDRRLASVPVVVCSVAEEIDGYAAALGAAGFLTKPFNRTQLLETVRKYYPSCPQPTAPTA